MVLIELYMNKEWCVCVYACVCVCVCICVYLCVCVSMRMCVFVSTSGVCESMCVYMCACVVYRKKTKRGKWLARDECRCVLMRVYV